MDVSSDSEDTIILPLNEHEPSDTEVENIINKYITSPSTSYQINLNNEINLVEDANLIEDAVCDTKFNDEHKSKEESKEKQSNKLKRKLGIEDKHNEKALEKVKKLEEVQRKKAEKNLEKERKKEMIEKEKLMKNALRTVARSTKPDECIKHITVEIDSQISEDQRGAILKETLQKTNISFKTKQQVLPNLITWCRKIQTIDNMTLKESEVSEEHVLLLLNETEFMEYIKNDTLTIFLNNIFIITKCKQLTIIIFGLDRSKPAHEIAITEAQLLTKSYFRFVKKTEDLAELIIELTKAVAQIPYKQKKEEKYKLLSEYFNDSNKDTVKIDKNGNGLGRLWHQMLSMFPLARLETAEAITAVYPTPSSLFEAFEACDSRKEELLQDLPIRRAIGPYTSARRIGPELSRKCFNFVCSTDNILL